MKKGTDKKDLRALIAEIGKVTESSEMVTSSDGDRDRYQVFRRENVKLLKELAPQHYPALALAFEQTKDKDQRLLLCECLQYARNSALKSLFEKLLEDEDREFRYCAIVALGKLNETNSLALLSSSVSEIGDRRMSFFLGIAFINAEDKRGVDLLVSVLKEEEAFLKYDEGGYVTVLRDTDFYTPTIDVILHSLFPDGIGYGRPLKWITWWEARRQSYGLIDPNLAASHLIEYNNDMALIQKISQKK